MYVNKDYLIEKYNLALFSLTGKKTSLKSFTIDIRGYSFEIEKELGEDYLGNNFIIISIEQKTLKLKHFYYSFEPFIFQNFIEENIESIANLTVYYSICGKINYSSDLNKNIIIKFSYDTYNNVLDKFLNFSKNLEMFEKEEDLNEEILRKITKDIKEIKVLWNNKIYPNKLKFVFKNSYHNKDIGFVFKTKNSLTEIIFTNETNEKLVVDFLEKHSFISYNLEEDFLEKKIRDTVLFFMNKKNNVDFREENILNFISKEEENFPKTYFQLKKLKETKEINSELSSKTKLMIMEVKSDLKKTDHFLKLIDFLIISYNKYDIKKRYIYNFKDEINIMLLKHFKLI